MAVSIRVEGNSLILESDLPNGETSGSGGVIFDIAGAPGKRSEGLRFYNIGPTYSPAWLHSSWREYRPLDVFMFNLAGSYWDEGEHSDIASFFMEKLTEDVVCTDVKIDYGVSDISKPAAFNIKYSPAGDAYSHFAGTEPNPLYGTNEWETNPLRQKSTDFITHTETGLFHHEINIVESAIAGGCGHSLLDFETGEEIVSDFGYCHQKVKHWIPYDGSNGYWGFIDLMAGIGVSSIKKIELVFAGVGGAPKFWVPKKNCMEIAKEE